ncbi:hypothetical protein HYALB_00003666 [Hymenoscyphus albidus]|uniref:Uncharacterized protein n=1 Tax=Hymenoscyphus albidus TaxID=595503 RepID=A0A9N9PSU0_9HELO|nr:hypothetical protein HYALB_00003666 [Hymenoscyphus albidus]
MHSSCTSYQFQKLPFSPRHSRTKRSGFPSITPQISEAVITFFLYNFLDDAAQELAVRLKTSKDESAADGSPKKEDSHTPSHSKSGTERAMPLFNVPHARNPNFVGRSAAISKLFAMWKPGNRRRVSTVDLGGIGDDELAVDGLQYHNNPESLVIVNPGKSFDAILQPGEDEPQVDEKRSFPWTVIIRIRSSQSGQQPAGPHGLPRSAVEFAEVARLMTYPLRAIVQVARLITSAGNDDIPNQWRSHETHLLGKLDRFRIQFTVYVFRGWMGDG